MAIYYTPAAERKFRYLVNLTKPWKKYIEERGITFSSLIYEEDSERFIEFTKYMRKRRRHLKILKRMLEKSTSAIDLDELDEKILLRLYENVMKGEADDG